MDSHRRQEELQTVVETIWTTMLGIPINRVLGEEDVEESGDFLASISISGAWDGTLELSCSEGLARFVGAALFQCDPWDLDEDSSVEAVLELANMIGGNVKALVGEGNHLGLPELQSALYERPTGVEEIHLLFDCLGEPLALQLIRMDE